MNAYNPKHHGSVVAIRIWLENGYQPMAELVFAFGGTRTIRWDNELERENYASGINAYTLMYDERPKRDFRDWIKPERESAEFVCPVCGEAFKFSDPWIKGFEDIERSARSCPKCGEVLQVYDGTFFHVETLTEIKEIVAKLQDSLWIDSVYNDFLIVGDVTVKQYHKGYHVYDDMGSVTRICDSINEVVEFFSN